MNPLIKYNPSSRQENIYRLYTDKISTDGRKIPYLKKATIIKLTKAIGRTKSVSVYIETSESQLINCEFDEEGYITMTAEFNTLVDFSQIDMILKKTINPIIQEIKTVLEQSGYKLNLFNSLNDENVEIKQMTYETNVKITKNFDFENLPQRAEEFEEFVPVFQVFLLMRLINLKAVNLNYDLNGLQIIVSLIVKKHLF